MAGESHLLRALRPQLERLDDEALGALASAGLLRRARKDLESLSPVVSETTDAITVDLGAHRVQFEARGPSQARCTCPAKTTCQHVLSAWLHLRTWKEPSIAGRLGGEAQADRQLPELQAARRLRASSPTEEPAQSLIGELSAIAVKNLIEFAGLPAVREALESVEADPPPEIVQGAQLIIRLAHPPVELRYAGGGLDAFVLDYRGKRRPRLIVQAVLALQRAAGISPPVLPTPASRKRARVAPSPESVVPRPLVAQVCTTLTECIQVGLPHLSENMEERLMSHAAAAAGAGLHRLELALTRLANHIDLQLGRSAATSTAALFHDLAQTHALAAAIQLAPSPVPALWGEARSEYEDIRRFELIGVAAEPWRTASGYMGLTTLFWSPSQRHWYSATDARPAGVLDFDPVARFRASGPWTGCASPAAACGARVILSDARVNRMGRLSMAASTSAQVQPLDAWPSFGEREFSEWAKLRETLSADTSGIGLSESNPHAAYVVLAPEDWLSASFDPTTQELHRDILDTHGEPLRLRIRYSGIAKHALERLESVRPARSAKVLGRIERLRPNVIVRPIALLQEDPARRVDNFFLDAAPAASLTDRLISVLGEVLGDRGGTPQDAENDGGTLTRATERRVAALETEILRVAERGVAGQPIERTQLRPLEESLRTAGIDLTFGAEPPQTPAAYARHILQLRYCLSLLRDLQR